MAKAGNGMAVFIADNERMQAKVLLYIWDISSLILPGNKLPQESCTAFS